MPEYLSLINHGAAGKATLVGQSVPGLSSSQIGNELSRIDKQNVGNFANKYAMAFKGTVLTAKAVTGASPEINRYIPNTAANKVRRLLLTGDPSAAVAAGETATGGTSGATGVTTEDYVTGAPGDNYAILQSCSVADFVDGEVVTFSGLSATATAATPALDAFIDGEHVRAFIGTATLGADFLVSGFFPYIRSDGNLGAAFMYWSGTQNIGATSEDGITWSGFVLGAYVSGGARFPGWSIMRDGLIYFPAVVTQFDTNVRVGV